MGGGLATRISIDHPTDFHGLILCAPALKEADDLYPILKKIARYVAEVAPTLAIAAPLSDKDLCIDTRIDTWHRIDPLFYGGRIRAQTGVQLLDLFDYLQANVERVKVPFISFHGELDVIIPIQYSSNLLLAKASTKDKTVKILSGEFHNFVQSPNYKEYASMTVRWLNDRLI